MAHAVSWVVGRAHWLIPRGISGEPEVCMRPMVIITVGGPLHLSEGSRFPLPLTLLYGFDQLVSVLMFGSNATRQPRVWRARTTNTALRPKLYKCKSLSMIAHTGCT